jgi:hypothetical protein
MSSAILTEGATFSCPHGGTGTVDSGITISALADLLAIDGKRPIAAGATIAGFTPALGCGFQDGTTPKPCIGFTLPPPSEPGLAIGGQAVYTAADLPAIKLVVSSGNGQPGLAIDEPQTKVLA